MTKEEHNLLVQNNQMLKEILKHVIKENNEDFVTNVLANMVSEQLMFK